MISDELGAPDETGVATGTVWRRGLDVLDDYAGGGVLSEELADDLVNDLACRSTTRRSRRGPHTGTRPGPQPRSSSVNGAGASMAPSKAAMFWLTSWPMVPAKNCRALRS